jgi:hypothetical protein
MLIFTSVFSIFIGVFHSFRSYKIHFELKLVLGERLGSSFNLLQMDTQFFQHNLFVKEAVFTNTDHFENKNNFRIMHIQSNA